jgi:hypothetical protein
MLNVSNVMFKISAYNNLITQRCTVILEKLIVAQLVMNLSVVY